MIDRIKSLLAVKNLTSSQFANEIGVQRSGISHILSGRNKPSLDFVLKILDHYPELSEKWLLKGEGEMYQGNNSNTLFNEELDEDQIFAKEEMESENNPEPDNKNKAVSLAAKKNKEGYHESTDEIAKEIVDDLLPAEKSDQIEKLIVVFKDKTFETLVPRN